MNNASPSSRPMPVDSSDDYRQRKSSKSKIPWLSATQLLVSSLQLLALVYVIGKWDKPAVNVRSDATSASIAQEANQNLIKGWHETLTLLKTSDEANAKLRDQIEKLEERLVQVETVKPAPAIGPLAEKDAKTPEKAKE